MLANAPVPSNPLDAAATEEARAQLAEALEFTPAKKGPALTAQVEDALDTLEMRRLDLRQRELRSQIAEAVRRGDQDMLGQLIQEMLQIDRQLRAQ